MKLAEALVQRKAVKEKLGRLKQRLYDNAKVQEGDQPNENPMELLREVDSTLTELETLIIRINRTNLATPMPDGSGTLMEAIARRDMLNLKYAILESLIGAAGPPRDRWAMTRSEIKWLPTVDVAQVQKEIDALAKAYRELDTQIQAVNWTVDLAE